MTRAAGFTLLEVLIAMAITALVATLSFSSLSAVLDSVEGVRDNREDITGMDRFWMLFTRDIRHYVHRPVRDEYGELEPGFWGGELADNALNFTRIGWHNPNFHPRGNLQRVRYLLEDETLYRESYPVLDRTGELEPQRVALLEGVEAFELAFLPEEREVDLKEVDTGNWEENWAVGVDEQEALPPRAIEIRLELEGWGEIRRLYQLP